MKVLEVTNRMSENIFYDLPRKLYKWDPHWVLQLGKDVEAIFNAGKNSAFRNGEAKRWILFNKYNTPAGRIAAFYNRDHEDKAGIGFFECSDDIQEASLLFDAAITWLKEKGYRKIEGPVNFGEKDKFWGLLTEGFEAPLYLDNYNFSYYSDHFKTYGFKEASEIHTYKLLLDKVPVNTLEQISSRLLNRHAVELQHLRLDDYTDFINKFYEVYASSFSAGSRMNMLRVEDLHAIIAAYKPFIKEKYIWLLNIDHVPAGIIAFIPDQNDALIRMFRSKRAVADRVKGFVFAVKPGFRKIGVEVALAFQFYKTIMEENRKAEVYFSGISSKTHSMTSFIGSLGAKLSRIHKTYTYEL